MEPMDPMTPSRPPLAARLRLARRVADVLLPQPEDVLVEASGSAERIAGESHEPELQTDFLVSVLDLRIRVALLPGLGADMLRDAATLEAAAKLLWSNPETLACMIVADDEQLSAVIVEFGDLSEQAASLWRQAGPEPVRVVLNSYLATLRPAWPDPASLDGADSVSLEGLVDQSSVANIGERGRKRSQVEERKLAREQLGSRESRFIASLTLDVLKGKATDFDMKHEAYFRDAK